MGSTSGLVLGALAAVLWAPSVRDEGLGDVAHARNVRDGVESRLYGRLRKDGQLSGRYFSVYVRRLQGRRLDGVLLKLRDEEGQVVLVAEAKEGRIEVDLNAGAIYLRLSRGTYMSRRETAPASFERRAFLVNQRPDRP